MPCRDYESDNTYELREMKKQADRLARIACKVMTALEAEGKEDFIMLQDDEVREWWSAHKIADAQAATEKAERARVARVKREALNKLSAEEKKLLGIKE